MLKDFLNKNAAYIYFTINPLSVRLLVYFLNGGRELAQDELLWFAGFMLVWALYGVFWLVVPQMRAFVKEIKERPEPPDIDKIIDDCWKQHEEEKNKVINHKGKN